MEEKSVVPAKDDVAMISPNIAIAQNKLRAIRRINALLQKRRIVMSWVALRPDPMSAERRPSRPRRDEAAQTGDEADAFPVSPPWHSRHGYLDALPSVSLICSRLASPFVLHHSPSMSEHLEPVPGTAPDGDLLFGTRADSLVFASGRQISSAALFPLLHWGGWIAFGAIPFAWSLPSWGVWGALVNNVVFVATGALICLGMRVTRPNAA